MTNTNEIIKETLKSVGHLMMVAARTAPKGRGIDNLEMMLLEKDQLKILIAKMKDLFVKTGAPVFQRDAETLEKVDFLFLIGTKISAIGLKYCGYCGFADCAEMQAKGGLCAFNPGDLGIALGSAVSVAADHRVDCRVLYSAGVAAVELGLLDREVKIIYGVPLSATAKNPFFDRK